MRARLIYNPSAGREEIKKRLPEVLDALEAAGLETSCHMTKGEGDATRAAEEAVTRGFDVVIAAGGDGTVYEVVNGLAGRPRRPKLGILPCGTSNDFATALGIPRSLAGACAVIAGGRTKAVDVGKMNDRYFINIAGAGWLTELTYEVPSRLKTLLGQMAYYVKGIEKLPFISPRHVQLRYPGGTLEADVMLVLVANSPTVGGFERLAPEADVSDGQLDVIVLKKTTLPVFVRLARQALAGQHVRDPLVVYFQTPWLEARSTDRVLVNLDGELGGELPCRIEVLPQHLEVFVPAGG
ncbi:MAG: diacylglycerol kinase [Calditerricola sp.]|jgi:lipid kinase, YegS/Rv2252/BmrU family|nr:diacylglycerol kinase [Bacillota bacterium]MCG0314903.1 diacylglycerol kinase [Calditerricola sp.]